MSIYKNLVLFIFSLCLLIVPLKAEDYFVHGTVSLGLKPTDPSLRPPNSQVLYFLALGDWRNDTGFASPEDLLYTVSIDRAKRSMKIAGQLNGF